MTALAALTAAYSPWALPVAWFATALAGYGAVRAFDKLHKTVARRRDRRRRP